MLAVGANREMLQTLQRDTIRYNNLFKAAFADAFAALEEALEGNPRKRRSLPATLEQFAFLRRSTISNPTPTAA